MRNLVDRLMLKLGYIPEDHLSFSLKSWEQTNDILSERLSQALSLKEDKITRALHEARMVSVALDDGYEETTLVDPPHPTFKIKERPPANSQMYTLKINIDAGVLWRLHEDLQQREIDYTIEVLLREIGGNIKTLMRMKGLSR